MYKLLIADDEVNLLNLIITQIDWASLGFEVMGARDGKEALALVNDGFAPDVLLTDIRMPFMDGLELSERLRAQYPNIAIIVLSGHDEFSYAKKSMQLGTSDYLLKPIRPKALSDIMQKLKLKLDAMAAQNKELARIHMQLEESLPILRQQYILMLMYESFPDEMIRDQFNYLGIHLDGQAYTVCLLSHSPLENPADKFFTCFAIQNILQKLFAEQSVCLFDNDGTQMIVCASPDESNDRNIISSKLEDAITQISSQFSLTATAAIGVDVSSLSDLPQSYKSALAALGQQVVGGSGNVYDALIDTAVLGNMKLGLPFALSEKIASIFPYEQTDVLRHSMITLFDNIRLKNCTDITYLRLVCSDFINNVHRSLSEYGEIAIDDDIYHKLFSAVTIDELEEITCAYVFELKQTSDAARKRKQKGLIHQAFEYIDENYSDPSLSLSAIAQNLFVSPSYLSNLFKRKCEMNFVDYVTKLRMEHAKKLLLTSELRTYEISAQIGYKDPQYFSNSFKKHTGMTPSEFRSGSSRG
ncbi:MAG: response regulator [Christensenella sp.]